MALTKNNEYTFYENMKVNFKRIERFGACRRRGFLAQKFNRNTAVQPYTNAQPKHFSPAFGKPLLN
jgi:hypothetical protein